MNLDERIESAWKEHWSTRIRESFTDFRAGYLAAIRSLFVEVKPKDARGSTDYWVFMDGEWKSVWWFCDEYATQEAKECERIFVSKTPSPAEIFREEQNDPE